ncbi:aspartate carbamoyltransferase [Candidatus Parcubacteria bacterium]|nr:MAG: aspartate carbamoyltransferase [Candidatus Parcubacteria bacterium]
MRPRHLITAKEFASKEALNGIFESAKGMETAVAERKPLNNCAGKILATVFYEPSTRTRFSFETAMYKLGGDVITSENAAEFSSAKKGESIEDAIRVISDYADAIVLRHPSAGAAETASRASLVPVINAGSGSDEHPTQALLDLYTIEKELGKIDDLSIAFVGDLRFGRTVHSTIYLLPAYRGVKVYLISPEELQLPEEYKTYLKEHGIPFEELKDIKEAVRRVDVLSITRVQQERFASREEYEKLKGSYVIDNAVLQELKDRAIIMHPLPRIDEIAKEVDGDVRAAYFRQTKNGIYVRMALLKMILA